MVMEFKACHDWCFRLTLIFFFSFISSPICCVCLGYLYMFSSCWLFLLLFFLYHIIKFIIFIVIINNILNGEAAKAWKWNRSYSCRYHSSLHIDSYTKNSLNNVLNCFFGYADHRGIVRIEMAYCFSFISLPTTRYFAI